MNGWKQISGEWFGFEYLKNSYVDICNFNNLWFVTLIQYLTDSDQDFSPNTDQINSLLCHESIHFYKPL